MRSFFTIWIGQLVSLIGSQLTTFALGVWVYDQTRSLFLLSLTQIAFNLPLILLSPLAGVLADRWNRRTAMIVSDFGAGAAVLAAAALYLTGQLRPWMAIPLSFVISAFGSLMWPAYSAAVTMLVPKEQYGRANGFIQLGDAIPALAGPALAGALYVAIHVGNMALIDGATYVFSVLLMLFFARIPEPPRTVAQRTAGQSIWQEMRFGWDYILERKGLLGLLTFFAFSNFLGTIMRSLFTPLVLDNWTPQVLGFLGAAMGAGVLTGTLTMSAWGGGKRKIRSLFSAALVGSLFLAAVGVGSSVAALAITGFGFMFCLPIIAACSQSVWQSKVAPDVQGRVFAVRRSIAWSAQILSPLVAATLADYVFKPAMAAGGWLSPMLGSVFGVGPSRGIGVLITLAGLLNILVTAYFFSNARIRNVETDLPDHAVEPVAAPAD
jgi:MFS family permease